MPRLPQMTPRQVEKEILKKGFVFERQKGSHKIYTKNSSTIVLPFGRKPIKKGLLMSILKEADLL